MSEETNQQQEKELTPAELEAMRKNMHQYYKDQINTLKLQSEYEKLLAEIEESRAKRMMYTIRLAQMMAGPQEESEEEEEHHQAPETEEPRKSRKLRTE